MSKKGSIIKWENFPDTSTPIPEELWKFISLLYEKNIIPNIPINAKFLNKYHPELLLEKYKYSIDENYDELKECFSDLNGGK